MAADDTIVDIADDDFVIRRIESLPHLHDDGQGGRRISKSAFSPSSSGRDQEQGMSCNSVALLAAEGRNLSSFAPETAVLAQLSVRTLREHGMRVEHKPRPGNYSHCDVYGVKDSGRKAMLRSADYIRCPPDVHI